MHHTSHGFSHLTFSEIVPSIPFRFSIPTVYAKTRRPRLLCSAPRPGWSATFRRPATPAPQRPCPPCSARCTRPRPASLPAPPRNAAGVQPASSPAVGGPYRPDSRDPYKPPNTVRSSAGSLETSGAAGPDRASPVIDIRLAPRCRPRRPAGPAAPESSERGCARGHEECSESCDAETGETRSAGSLVTRQAEYRGHVLHTRVTGFQVCVLLGMRYV